MARKRIRILLADDHALFRDGLKRIIEMEPDMEVIGELSDGSELVDHVRKSSPDVILMDINMPVLNGVEATREVTREIQGVKVIILSIHDDEQYVYRALQNGASGYLLKEMDAEALIEAIRAVASGDCYIHPKVTGMLIKEYRRLYEDAVNELHPRMPMQDKKTWDRLTDREKDVLRLLAAGKSNLAISETLGISDKTVKNHVSSILLKMGAVDRTQAVVEALKKGWIELSYVKEGHKD
ncbi:two-component response regulator [[Clostridium] ultunense Esp]|uniref:response regulator transcription factor n=1 Tax=Thermicanus aegyptius TaxID=94009 RepID=UPI0002B6FF4C|nr:response regulator transcription factor [Thermicanus aegyptius]CCQ95733.1 two-component response regulator [[Clostridium] ultunense Esp]